MDKGFVSLMVAWAILGAVLNHHKDNEIASLRSELAEMGNRADEPEKMAPRTASQARHTLFDAIRQVESGGWNGKLSGPDYDPSDIGQYQVTWAWWQDAFDGSPLSSYESYRRYAFDAEVVEQGMDRYWARYGAVTDEEKARAHRCGPDNWYTERGDRYWAKVQEAMK